MKTGVGVFLQGLLIEKINQSFVHIDFWAPRSDSLSFFIILQSYRESSFVCSSGTPRLSALPYGGVVILFTSYMHVIPYEVKRITTPP